MMSDLQRHSLWPVHSKGTTDAKAKRPMMHHLSNENVHEEGSADGRDELWDTLPAAYKDKMSFRMPCMVDEMETLKLKQCETSTLSGPV